MNAKHSLVFLALLASLALNSCSGLPNKCTVNCTVTGNANVTLTLFDTPPSGVLFLNFNLPITSISLTPSGGGADVNLLSSLATYETTHLQSDTAFVGTYQVASGTYTALNIFVTNSPSGVWYNGSGATLLGCVSGGVCSLAGGAPGKIVVDLTKAIGGAGLVLSANQNIGLGLDFNLSNALTTAGGMTLDLTQPNVFTVVTLPRTNQSAGTLDTIQNFTGIVTVVNSSSITVQSPIRGTVTAALNSNTVYTEVPNLLTQCTGSPSLSCINLNSTVSVDATIGTTGTLTATVVDIIDLAAVDEVEGTIYPTSTPSVYGMIVSDKAVPSGNVTLAPVVAGTGIYVTLTNSAIFTIDGKDFPVVAASGFSGSADLTQGQTVRVQVASLGTFNNLIEVTGSAAILRFTTFTANVGTTAPTSTVFYYDNTTINPFYGSFLTQPQVQTYTPQTIIDGVANLNSLAAGDSVSVSTLFLNPTSANPAFLATKVRKH